MRHPPDAHVQPSTLLVFQLVTGEGHDALGIHAEQTWLPVLGPTCYLLARRVIHEGGSITSYTAGELARDLGVSPNKVVMAAKRLVRFGPGEYEDRIYEVPTRWPEAPAPLDWPSS